MTKRWNPDLHDAILSALHGTGLTDRDVTCRMLDGGHPVSSDDVAAARRRLGLKANKANPARPPIPQDKPNPLAQAKLWLGGRLVEKSSGYWLDGRPASMTTVIQAFNEMRVCMKLPQIDTNQNWRVPE